MTGAHVEDSHGVGAGMVRAVPYYGGFAVTSHRAPAPPALSPAVVADWQAGGGSVFELLSLVNALGPVARVSFGAVDAVLVSQPEAVHHVLALHPERYVKRSHRLAPLLGGGVLTASGDPWRAQRRLLQRHFTGQGIRRFEGAIDGAAERASLLWERASGTGEVRDLAGDLRFYSLDVIWRCLTGRPVTPETYEELRAVDAIIGALPVVPRPGDAPPDLGPEFARIDAVVERTIAEVRASPSGAGLLHVLLEAYDTEQLVRDEVATLIFAGHETTATTLAWLYLFLDAEPHWRAWALERGADGVRALLAETLRLYPVAWLMPRHATEDDVLAGYRVGAGDIVLTSPYFTHRDPGLWPEPDAFRPDRPHLAERHPAGHGAYYPFGLGPRACLGAQFTHREAQALLERVLPAFVPKLLDRPGPAFDITVHPAGPLPGTIQRA
ncbi:cytochrome P450 [Streptomyces sp. NPDC048604]|uniref:cytochrome P450 n=1 Tax=Streptomyces sp. NPDC048604 TaxID=3365578 RepID=UPI003710417B